MKRILVGGLATIAAAAAVGYAGGVHYGIGDNRNYWQGGCDGLRASGLYPMSKKVTVVDDERGVYFACNGELPDDVPPDMLIHLHITTQLTE